MARHSRRRCVVRQCLCMHGSGDSRGRSDGMGAMTLDEAIETVEAAGLAIVRPRNKDESLRNMWEQVHSLLRMMTDLAEDGARLTLTHPAYFAPTCDYKLLTRTAIIG